MQDNEPKTWKILKQEEKQSMNSCFSPIYFTIKPLCWSGISISQSGEARVNETENLIFFFFLYLKLILD